MCIKLSSLCRRFVVGRMEFGWVRSCVQSFHFAMGQSFDGLVEEIGGAK